MRDFCGLMFSKCSAFCVFGSAFGVIWKSSSAFDSGLGERKREDSEEIRKEWDGIEEFKKKFYLFLSSFEENN